MGYHTNAFILKITEKAEMLFLLSLFVNDDFSQIAALTVSPAFQSLWRHLEKTYYWVFRLI